DRRRHAVAGLLPHHPAAVRAGPGGDRDPLLPVRLERLLLRPDPDPHRGDDGAGGSGELHELRRLGMGPHRRRRHHDHAAGACVLLRGAALSGQRIDRGSDQGMTGVLLITGGASGIGAETARRAAKRGYKVAINYRSRDAQAMGLAADIAAQDGEAIALPGDMANEADIVRLFHETERTFGPITHLVNSAGIGRPMRVDEYDSAKLT